ncbi:hypothetical protein FRC07_011190 [Ceratobasidium sp. 392]|nr:hypothetical protein FRC07_011190 [Ceratobasidium sp. 392]
MALRSAGRVSSSKAENRQPPWHGFEHILIKPLGHEQGFDEYQEGQDPGIVWTISRAGREGNTITAAPTPPKPSRARPKMRAPPVPSDTVLHSDPESGTPAAKRQRTEQRTANSPDTPTLQTPGASSNVGSPSAQLPAMPRTPASSPCAARKPPTSTQSSVRKPHNPASPLTLGNRASNEGVDGE